MRLVAGRKHSARPDCTVGGKPYAVVVCEPA
jgi:hypothetical protein